MENLKTSCGDDGDENVLNKTVGYGFTKWDFTGFLYSRYVSGSQVSRLILLIKFLHLLICILENGLAVISSI